MNFLDEGYHPLAVISQDGQLEEIENPFNPSAHHIHDEEVSGLHSLARWGILQGFGDKETTSEPVWHIGGDQGLEIVATGGKCASFV